MKRHDAVERDDLAGEHKAGHAIQITSFFVFMGVWISDSFFLQKTTFLNDLVPNIVRVPLGIIALLTSWLLAVKSHRAIFHQRRESHAIVQNGVYSQLRHPMYLSELLAYLALILFSLSLASVAVFLVLVVFFHWMCRYEEKLLLEHFGEAYREYCRQVPMWLPGLKNKAKRGNDEKS